MVQAELDGPILRYSRRQALLQRARRLGIGRFDANLIIAAAQHDAGRWRIVRDLPPRRRWLTTASAFIFVEALVVGWFWWLCR